MKEVYLVVHRGLGIPNISAYDSEEKAVRYFEKVMWSIKTRFRQKRDVVDRLPQDTFSTYPLVGMPQEGPRNGQFFFITQNESLSWVKKEVL